MYINSEKGIGGSEQSRFIHQLINFRKPNHKIKFLNTKTFFEKDSSLDIKKTTNLINILKANVKKGISPSALSKFMIDPMGFYFDYILGDYFLFQEDSETHFILPHCF